MTDYIRFDNDKWDDMGKVYRLIEYSNQPETTCVRVVIEDTVTKKVECRYVARNQIEFLEAKDW